MTGEAMIVGPAEEEIALPLEHDMGTVEEAKFGTNWHADLLWPPRVWTHLRPRLDANIAAVKTFV